MMVNDFTIIIQGPIHRNTITMISLHPHIKTIVSTWNDPKWEHPTIEEHIKTLDRPNLKVVVSEMPDEQKVEKVYNSQNRYYQFLSTLNGLRLVDTPYAIKVRSDEYFTNLLPVMQIFLQNPEKLVTSDIFFRRVEYLRYHISDHIMCCNTKKMTQMFEEMVYDCEFNIDKLKYAPFSQHDFWLFVEQQIGMKYVEISERVENKKYRIPTEYQEVKEIMMRYFDVVNTGLLGEFYITANCEKKVYINTRSYYDDTRDISDSLEEL